MVVVIQVAEEVAVTLAVAIQYNRLRLYPFGALDLMASLYGELHYMKAAPGYCINKNKDICFLEKNYKFVPRVYYG